QRARAQVAAEASHQAHDVAPDQGLAPGQPDLAHAEVDERRAQPLQLLQREQARLRQVGHGPGHAVHAAEVAAVGHRDPHIADAAAEGIDHHAKLRSRIRWLSRARRRRGLQANLVRPGALVNALGVRPGVRALTGPGTDRTLARQMPANKRATIGFRAADTPEAQAGLATLKARYAHVPPEEADVVVALGGDGFMLETLHGCIERPVPIYGMNLGTVGFLLHGHQADRPPD